MECSAWKASAPVSDRKQPDIFCLTLSLRIPRSEEKARVFDPFGHAGFDPFGQNKIDPLKVLAAGVNVILPHLMCHQAFLAFSLRMLSPVSSIECAEWTMRSRMASATVGSPTISYQLDEGYCEVMMIDLRS